MSLLPRQQWVLGVGGERYGDFLRVAGVDDEEGKHYGRSGA